MVDYLSKVISADKKFDKFRLKIEKDIQSRKIYEEVFDEATLYTLYNLSKKFFSALGGCISSGKEANIFYALDKDNNELILKIYRISTSNFRKMGSYLALDPRYPYKIKNRRQIIYNWVKREYTNLIKAKKAGCSSPDPIACKNNILIMEFIGSGGQPAPKLKDIQLKNIEEVYYDVSDNMKRLYQNNIIHADLSEYNILYEKKCVFIDFSQSLAGSYENFDEFLQRDIKNIVNFFQKLGFKASFEKLKSYIVGEN